MMEFFNAGDIEVLNRVGHKSFRGDDAQNEYDAQLIKNGPLAKTDYWADELAKRLPDFMFTKNHHWQPKRIFQFLYMGEDMQTRGCGERNLFHDWC